MEWNYGFSANYYVAIVDPATWKDVDRIEITGGKINRSTDTLRESADLDCVNYDGSREQWIRIYLNARQEGSSERVALFTGLATSPGRDIDGFRETNQVQCYSVLKPARDILLQRGWYAPAGVDGTELIKRLLRVLPAPIEIGEGSPALQTAIIAEKKESNLSMALKILEAINWDLQIRGDGTIVIQRRSDDEVATFSALENDSIEPKVKITQDWYECPNVFRAIADNKDEVARDDNPDSLLSTVSRGREIWLEEDNCDLNDGETLKGYAARRLREKQTVSTTISYDRRYDPSIYVGDVVRLHYPTQNINGLFRVTKQDIDLTFGAQTSEEVLML